MNNKRLSYIFFAVVSIAFFIRLWGIWNVTTTDEYNEVIEALRICSGHFNLERWIKRFYLYILALQYSVYFTIGWVFDVFQNPMDFAERIVRNMEPLFMIGRFTSVLAGAITVALLYKVGETFFNKRVGTISSLLLTFTVFHVDLSQQTKVDALLGLLVTATFYFIFQLLCSDSRNKWSYAWCGFFMALSVQTKINSVVLIVPFMAALWLTYQSKRDTIRYLTMFSIFFVVGFIIANPPVVIAPIRFLVNIVSWTKVYHTPVNVIPNEIIGFLAYPMFYYKSMGFLISVVTALALLGAFTTLDRRKIVILTYICSFCILMGPLTSLIAPYYLVPIMPLLYLLIGDFLDSQYNRLLAKKWLTPRTTQVLAIVFALAMLFVPAHNVTVHLRSLSGPNTRYISKDWIEANIPPGSKILLDSGKSINSAAPLIAESRQNIETVIRAAKENISQGRIVHEMVDTNALVYYELLLKTVPEKAYDITSTMFGLQVKTIDYYIANGYEYLIISESMKESRTGEYARKNLPHVAEFYLSLDTDNRVQFVHVVAPTATNRGDTFLIYRLRS